MRVFASRFQVGHENFLASNKNFMEMATLADRNIQRYEECTYAQTRKPSVDIWESNLLSLDCDIETDTCTVSDD